MPWLISSLFFSCLVSSLSLPLSLSPFSARGEPIQSDENAAVAAPAAAASFAVAAEPPAAQPPPSPASSQRHAELPSYLGFAKQHLLVRFRGFRA